MKKERRRERIGKQRRHRGGEEEEKAEKWVGNQDTAIITIIFVAVFFSKKIPLQTLCRCLKLLAHSKMGRSGEEGEKTSLLRD